MESNLHEMMATLYEMAFPGAAGTKLVALTRKQGDLDRRREELFEKLEATAWRDSEEVRQLVGEHLKVVKDSLRISNQLSRELNRVRATLKH